jgi:hypothetical protein
VHNIELQIWRFKLRWAGMHQPIPTSSICKITVNNFQSTLRVFGDALALHYTAGLGARHARRSRASKRRRRGAMPCRGHGWSRATTAPTGHGAANLAGLGHDQSSKSRACKASSRTVPVRSIKLVIDVTADVIYPMLPQHRNSYHG